jgi:uncharacterized protein YbaP (TraB family)
MVEGDASTLVAVGATHLVGPDGLIGKLADAGVLVDRLV